jgi:pimeloyl-ACP methyl ester carboxylesterase
VSDPVQVSVRQPLTNSGGPVVPAWEQGGHLDGRGNLIILVHGFNVSRTDALGSYGQFLDNLKKKFNTQTAPIAEFLWPGDEPNKIISTLSYPNQIKPAIDSGRALAAFLSGLQHSGPLVVNLVGHSLGCRVILEMLAEWTGGLQPNVFVGVVVLMAAAVVVKQVNAGGALRSAATMTLKNSVLYSEGDPVLHWTFPIGETAAGEGFFPTAVGRTGGPGATWHSPYPMSHNGVAYVHGSYWPGEESATAVAFALGGAPARITSENGVVASPPPVENSIASRATPVRNLDSRPAFG